MASIEMIEEAKATGKVKEIYEEIKSSTLRAAESAEMDVDALKKRMKKPGDSGNK